MGLYKNTNGVLTPIAGKGKAEYGASTVRKGSVSSSATIPAFGNGTSYETVSVIFDTPMPDADYEVILTGDRDGYALTGYTISSKTKNGFKVGIDNFWNQGRPIYFTYTAFKLYTDKEYNDLLTITRPDLWPANTEIDFGNGLYGQRFTGRATKTQLGAGLTLVNASQQARVYSVGGMIDMSGTDGSNWYNIDGSWDGSSGMFEPLFVVYSNTIRFYCKTHITEMTHQYDIWATYSK